MTLYVSEIFGPTIQGEGQLAGQPAAFLRLEGCDQRCQWCDTAYALERHSGALSEKDIVERLAECLPAGDDELVVLTGGNPCLQDCRKLLRMTRALGWQVAVETQGTKRPAWLASVDRIVLSPKPPSSGCAPATLDDLFVLRGLGPKVELKIAVLDSRDLEFAHAVACSGRLIGLPTSLVAVTLAGEPVSDTLARYRQLIEAALVLTWPGTVRILPQLHVLAWGQSRGH